MALSSSGSPTASNGPARWTKPHSGTGFLGVMSARPARTPKPRPGATSAALNMGGHELLALEKLVDRIMADADLARVLQEPVRVPAQSARRAGEPVAEAAHG